MRRLWLLKWAMMENKERGQNRFSTYLNFCSDHFQFKGIIAGFTIWKGTLSDY